MTTSTDTDTDSAGPVDAAAPEAAPYSRTTLVLGLIGRAWIWFIVGCLAISLVPLLFGWQSFVIKSGSMEPRISVGDIVLTSPIDPSTTLQGHVIAFDAPAKPGEVLVHRAVGVDPAGLLITKGDANHTPDSAHVERSHVHGLGRLLVRYVGLPVVWTETGQWLKLLAFLASIGLAVLAIARDDDPEPEPDPDETDGAGTDGDEPKAEGTDRADSADAASGSAADAPPPTGGPAVAERGRTVLQHVRRRLRQRPVWIPRVLVVLIGTLLMVIPGAYAAFSATTSNTGNTFGIPFYNYTTETVNLGPYLYWKLDETGTATVAADSSGNGRTGTYNPSGAAANFTRLTTGALVDQAANAAVQPVSATACINTTSTTAIAGPTSFTEIVWFKAPAGYTAGGKLIGFETPRTGVAVAGSGGTYDRHIYMDGAGKIWFGVYNNADMLIGSPGTYNDGAWHMAAATIGAGGMKLYIDGVSVGTNANTVSEATTGWFRVGCGNLSGWSDGWTGANTPPASSTATNYVFKGGLDEATVYMSVLTPAQVAFLYWIR